MREIKFRAWDVFNADMFPAKHNDDLLAAFFSEVNKRRNGGNTVHVMQYTGLKDKNGVEIYEGDIVKFDDGDGWEVGRGIISWKDFFGVECDGVMYPAIHNGTTEVIGNIHENPELLEGS